jgi:zinc transport system substrate-binding protein
MRRLFSLSSLLASLFYAGYIHAEAHVLTSIKPLQLIAAAVQEGLGEPQSLLPAGASAHHYSLRPSDIRHLSEAELFYWIGPDMETFLIEVLAERKGSSLALQSLPGVQLRHFAGEAAGEHDESEEEADADAAHRPGALDAHLWLSPTNARVIAQRMAEDLARVDPANASRYQQNLQGFEQRLAALDQRLQQRLRPLAQRPFFVFHEAYNYFEAAYGLQHQAAFHLSDEAQPGARHVAHLRERLQQAGPCCVFSEPPLRPRLAQTLSAGLPVTLAELDVLGVGLPVSAQGYEQLLEQLADQLATCLERP